MKEINIFLLLFRNRVDCTAEMNPASFQDLLGYFLILKNLQVLLVYLFLHNKITKSKST
jgi:hypothetical protein